MIKIAIVDDNLFLQKTVQEKLSFFEDIEIKSKSLNGKELLQKLEKNSNLDLILMDIEMPDMNGVETTAEVKKRYRHIKVLMLTVFDNDEKSFEQKIKKYCSQPISFKFLVLYMAKRICKLFRR